MSATKRVAGVEGRVVGQRQHLTGPGVQDDRESGFGASVLDRLAQHPLGVPLEIHVEGGVEILAVDRLHDGVLPQRDPVATADLVARGAVGTGEQPVEGALETCERDIGPDEPDEIGGDVLGRVVTQRVTSGAEPREAALLGVVDHLQRDRGGNPAGDELEPASLLAQPGQDREVVDVEPVGQELGDLRRLVGGELRVGPDHQPVDRSRQRLSVAVQDVAARGRQRHVHQTLGGRHLGVRVGIDALQLDQPYCEDRQHHRDRQEAEPQPEQRRAAQAAAGPAGAGRGAHGRSRSQSRLRPVTGRPSG